LARAILDKYRQQEGCDKHGLPWVDTSVTIAELIERYWQSKPSLGGVTHRKKERILQRLSAAMGDKKVSAVSLQDVDEFMSKFLGHVKDNSKGTYLNNIASLWSWGIKRKLAKENPWSEIKFSSKPNTPRRCLTDEEIGRILSKAKGEQLLAICLGLYQGARIGDCINLYAEDIDFRRKLITFRARKGSREGAPRVQILPLHPLLEQMLSKMSLTSGQRLIPLSKSRLGTTVSEVMEAAGVDATHHYLRHTFITERINNQAGLAQVSQLAGHSSWNITKKYTHLSPENLRGALMAGGSEANRVSVQDLADSENDSTNPSREISH
jgi:site-specific recombinase XerD